MGDTAPKRSDNQQPTASVSGAALKQSLHVLQQYARGERGFTGANISDNALRGADLRGVRFENSKLADADLRHANLTGSVFSKTDLHNTNLQDTRLVGADLTKAQGLRAGQVAGADLSGAALPEGLKRFDQPLSVVEDASKNSRTLFLSMLAVSAYMVIAVATTTDAQLVLSEGAHSLPIIGADVPTIGFLFAAPILVSAIFLYFHLYLQRLWEQTSSLPAYFPDGRPLDEAIYPWLLSGIIRRHVPLLKRRQPAYEFLQAALSFILAWLVAPLTVAYIWARSLARHDPALTVSHILVLTSLCLAATVFRKGTVATLSRSETPKRGWSGKQVTGLASVCLVGGISWFLSKAPVVDNLPVAGLANLALPIYHPFPGRVIAREARFSGKSLRGLDLTRSDLSRATLEDANLMKASLEGANLSGANLARAILRGVSLKEANLSKADLSNADLRGANLEGANLAAAILDGAWLDEADLQGADLANASLKHARLFKAVLVKTRFSQAAFLETNLTDADLRSARDFERGQLDNACGKRSVYATIVGAAYPREWYKLQPCSEEAEKLRLATEDARRRSEAARREAEKAKAEEARHAKLLEAQKAEQEQQALRAKLAQVQRKQEVQRIAAAKDRAESEARAAAAKLPPKKSVPCGCAPGDLMCAMKCAAKKEPEKKSEPKKD